MTGLQAGHLWIAWAVAMPALGLYLWRGPRASPARILAVMAFVTYLVVVASFTLLPLRFDPEYRAQRAFDPAIVLAPFFVGDASAVMSPTQYLGNVLLGVPFGFLVPIVWPMPLSRVLLAGLGFSLAIEALQWVATKLVIAFPSRATDINDVVLNTIGVILGIVAYVVMQAVWRSLRGVRRPAT
jgi:glycopeptide antibiotics resistance protein